MKYYQIEVDEEVYKYLKGKAEPFVDTPNKVLRRELLKEDNEQRKSTSPGRFPDLPNGIPTALQHTLEVIYLVKQKGIPRPEATKVVANRHDVAPQTVLDKYCRQLNKKAYEIDRLLEDTNLKNFQNLLTNKYANHNSLIRKFFNGLS